MIQLPVSLQGLARYERFLICKLVDKFDKKTGKTKKTKVPVHPSGLYAHSPKDPAIWLSADAAIKMLNEMDDPNYLLGFWFSDKDPYFFLDVDGAYDEEAGTWNEYAQDMINRFPGAAVEVSQSGSGLHIIGRGSCPPHGTRYVKGGLELYTHSRFIAFGLLNPQGDCDTEHSIALCQLVEDYFQGNAAVDDGEWNDAPVEGSNPIEDDGVLVNKALVSKSPAAKFGAKASFKQLWENDEDALAQFWPPDNDHDPYNRSHADMALAQHLAFWTGGDHARIERLMRQSALMRDKWDDRKGYYLPMTIRKAVNSQINYYRTDFRPDETDNPTAGPAKVMSDQEADAHVPDTGTGFIDFAEPEVVTGSSFMTIEEQKDFFKGMVYVKALNRVYISSSGEFMDQSTFKNSFAGYSFSLDSGNDKTTDDPWRAFVGNKTLRWPKVNRVDLNPERLGENVYIEEETGHKVANIYRPPNRPIIAGDPGPYLDMLERQVPDERDREIMLCYMASLVQNPGKKFRYALVVQGTEGNGKSTHNRVIRYCIGSQYTYSPKAVDLVKSGGKFNGWMPVTLFAIVEEIKMPRGDDAEQAMKQYITGDEIEVERKGVDQTMMPLRMNFMFNINDKSHLAISRDNRRWCPIYTAQQSRADLMRDGMDNDYWVELNDWLKNRDGYAIAAHYLLNYKISEEFNPLNLSLAPRTSAYEDAIEHGLTPAAAAIKEAIDCELPGFCGGWVSTWAASEYLQTHGLRYIRGHALSNALQELDYGLHPHLPQGKVTRQLAEEGGGKPKVYLRQGHIALNETDSSRVTDLYIASQGYASRVPPGAQNFAK